jgi:hypothetical protein
LLLVHHLLAPKKAGPRVLGVGVVDAHDLNNGRAEKGIYLLLL